MNFFIFEMILETKHVLILRQKINSNQFYIDAKLNTHLVI